MCRSINGKPGLRVPKDVVEEKGKRYRRKGRIIHRAEQVNESVFDIISKYQSEFRGIVNYYQLAYNVHSIHRLKWVMENSLTKTLAHKLRVPVSKIDEKYGTELTVDDRKYKGLQVSIPRQDKKPLIATWGGIPLTRNIKATLEEPPPEVWAGRSELVQRLLADFCELCGSPKDVEVHHVRGMRKLHEYPGRPKPEWVKRMIAFKRKTLLLCKTCHEEVEHGLPMTQPAISLTEVKSLRKRAGLRNSRAVCSESCTSGSQGGGRKSTSNGNSSAPYPTIVATVGQNSTEMSTPRSTSSHEENNTWLGRSPRGQLRRSLPMEWGGTSLA